VTFLPMDDRDWLAGRGYNYQELEDPQRRVVVVRAFPLPPGKYQVTHADILVAVPVGYPDTQLDMFYCDPQLRIVPANRVPSKAEVVEAMFDRQWQRWSRHYKPGQWRRGIDDLSSHFDMIAEELRKAS